ncbi:Uncharacterised protein [Bacillus tequilensis]|nr:Uncharacterised protein [Bacillus tequilensis]
MKFTSIPTMSLILTLLSVATAFSLHGRHPVFSALLVLLSVTDLTLLRIYISLKWRIEDNA